MGYLRYSGSWCEFIDCLTGENFWDWSKYRGDSAEISAEVEKKFEKNLRHEG